jgi:outer membrane protein insertion porin family
MRFLAMAAALAACSGTPKPVAPPLPTPTPVPTVAALALDELEGMWIDELLVVGTDEELITAAIRSTAGARARLRTIGADVLAVYGTGRVHDVRVEAWRQGRGAALRYVVTPAAATGRVTFEGNRRLTDAVLRVELASPRRATVDPASVHADARALAELYHAQGYLDATVASSIEGGDIEFAIVEGPVVVVRALTFTGNRAARQATLAPMMVGADGENAVGGRFDAQLLRDHAVYVSAHYYDLGYVNVFVGDPIVTRTADRAHVEISIPIEEGKQYRLGALSARGTLAGTPASYVRALGVKRGAIFNRTALAAGIEAVRQLHAAYASVPPGRVEVTPLTTLHAATLRVDIVLEVSVRTP